jgi:hypothetical protein
MKSDDAGAGRLTFHTDRRGVWRVTWTLAWGFLLVAWLMRGDGAALWPLFAGVALLLVGLGVSALLAGSTPLLGVWPEGLRVFAGRLGLGGQGDASAFTIPWSAIEQVGFEPRQAAVQRGEIHPHTVIALCFRLRASAPQPDGQRGFLEPVAGRGSERALGEHFVWSPTEVTLDLLGHPRGGFSRLTAAIARAEPRLGDASAGRRPSLGGPLAYAVYDAGVALAVLGTLALWATGRMDVYAELGRRLLAWGGSLSS